MLTRSIAACLVLLAVSPLVADTTIQHVAGHTSGWRGAYNNSASYCWIDGWPGTNADANIADFDRTAVQNAINTQITASGGWNAKLIVTQVGWTGNPAIPADLGPVVGVIQVDASTFGWGHISDTSPSAFSAGYGSWTFNGTTYANFVAAYNASAAAGKSFVFSPSAAQWTSYKDAALPDPNCWNVAIDIPEDLVVRYLNNTAAEGFFVSATKASPGISLYQTDQWGGVGDMRLLIAAPPTTAPWINASLLNVNRTIALTSPTYSTAITVTNAGTGTLNWTAAESPDVAWMTLTNTSGTAGGQFQVAIDVTGLAVGAYASTITVTAPGANNSVTIPVNISVVATGQPIIEVVPTSLTFVARPTDATVPASQSVQVNNTGLGTMTWSAAQQAPSVSWITGILPWTGAAGARFNVSVDHRGLAAGVYTKTILVTDPTASNSPQTVTVTLQVREQDANIATANSYDDAWEDGKDGWAASMWHLRLNATGKNAGFVLLLGDSITYSSAFGSWARAGSGKTPADSAICTWMHANTGASQTSNDGWFLARYDVPGRNGSYTARSSITTSGFLAGWGGLPSLDQMVTAGFTNPDGKQYRDAEMAVILLGTNDLGGTPAATVAANLGTMIDKLLASKIIPVLTTVPPRSGTDVTPYVTAVRNLAQSRKVPLIDYYQEIIRRRPGTSWQNTLISSDGVHPSGDRAGYTTSSDPYASSGAALSEVGYLLRSWLTVQKIAEVKAKVWDVKPGDFNADNSCDVIDLLTFVESFGLSKGDANYDQRCDFDGNDSIDVIDLLDFIPYFGT